MSIDDVVPLVGVDQLVAGNDDQVLSSGVVGVDELRHAVPNPSTETAMSHTTRPVLLSPRRYPVTNRADVGVGVPYVGPVRRAEPGRYNTNVTKP